MAYKKQLANKPKNTIRFKPEEITWGSNWQICETIPGWTENWVPYEKVEYTHETSQHFN